MYEFNNITDRRQGYSKKYHKYPASRDIIPLWVADMDFFVAPEIYKELEQTLKHRVFGYSIRQDQVKEVIAKFISQQYDYNIHANDVIWLPGLVAGINLACRTLTTSDESILTLTPIYPPFISAPQYAQRKLFTSTLIEQNDQWVINFEEIEQLLANRCNNIKLLLLCNPHNPTGRAWTKDELTKLHHLAEKYNLYVCSDEIHSGLILNKNIKHIPFASLNQDATNRTVTLMAPTKTFNIAGLACAYAISTNNEIKQKYRTMMDGLYSEINVFGVAACEAALTNGGHWLKSVIAYLQSNQELITKAVKSWQGFKFIKNDATYLAWLDGREFAKMHNINNLQEFFEKHGVGLSAGEEFGATGFLRLNFATSSANLEKALLRMTNAINNYK